MYMCVLVRVCMRVCVFVCLATKYKEILLVHFAKQQKGREVYGTKTGP